MATARTVTIISDLHLGGAPDFRMMTEPERLADFIASIAARDPSRERQELVINGDFVDFLAEVHERDRDGTPRWQPFIEDPARAVECFGEIARGMDAPVFDALAKLLERGHRLTILPGNHDVELCLPAVRQAVLERLEHRPGHDLHFQYDGEGYVIGDALVEHGNRYDESNFIDHERLHNLRVKQSLRQAAERPSPQLPFAPPLGSFFVARVMNGIKREHPFIDLLKPEGPALVALLLAIDPGLRDTVKELAKLTKEHARRHAEATKTWKHDTVYRGGRPRGAPEPAETADPELELGDVVGDLIGQDLLDASPDVATAASPGPRTRGEPTRSGVAEAWELLQGGGWEVVRLLVGGRRIKEVKRLELLRRAVKKMGASPAFERDRDEPDSPYLALARDLARSDQHSQGFRYVIFGHTHHAKDIALDGGARYLNSGTWANLMRFPAELFDPKLDEPAATAVLRGFVDDLEGARFAKHICFRPTFVRLELDDAGTVSSAKLEDA